MLDTKAGKWNDDHPVLSPIGARRRREHHEKRRAPLPCLVNPLCKLQQVRRPLIDAALSHRDLHKCPAPIIKDHHGVRLKTGLVSVVVKRPSKRRCVHSQIMNAEGLKE